MDEPRAFNPDPLHNIFTISQRAID